ncbi:unnamed protein product [Somion occarium]|uniref:Zn(2)-C6 fungal-type domain-containing protein n=1 Tax=Somion occarium TaxID=3059160 RepID=A0ABP1DT96_9APHY
MSTQSQGFANSPTEGGSTLPRGAACLPCRKRKMRCDGNQPACGQCVSKRREEDCEYTTAPGLTRTQMLEENIALLEARIRELENPDERPSVKLRDPHAPSIQLGQLDSIALPSGAGKRDSAFMAAQTGGLGNIPPFSNPITTQDKSRLIDAFVLHASQVGFFLHAPRLLMAAYGPVARGSLLEALLNAIYVWGSHFSVDPTLRGREAELLALAVHGVSGSLFVSATAQRGQDILYGIQAEVLLANYYFSNGRFLEGRYHTSAAISLAISCRLNLIRSNQVISMEGGSAMIMVSTQTAALVDPLDGIEEGERINAFWAVYVLDKTWAVALKSPSAISEDGLWGIQIDTPWPLAMEAYERGALANVFSSNTVQTFLAGLVVTPDMGHAPLALRAQATILYSRASWMASQYRDGMPNIATLQDECLAFDGFVTNFISTLTINPRNRDDLVTLTLARVALIQLHVNFASTERRSRDSCMAAARAALAVIRDICAAELGYIDPIMAILWTAIGQVFIREIDRVKAKGTGQAGGDAYLNDLTSCVAQTTARMADFSSICPIMAIQATQLQQAYQGVM